MSSPLLKCRAFAALLIAALLSACGHAGSVLPPSNFSPSQVERPLKAVPPDCPGEKLKKKFGSVNETLSTSGGSLCIPAFGGFGGTIEYPSVNPSVGIKLTSSTTNYNGALPSLGKGKPIFYVQLSIAGATTFGTNVPAGGGLAGKELVPAQTYTAFAQASADGISEPLTPCYLTAGKSKYGGVISGIGTLLKGLNVPVPAQGIVEIYSGKQAKSKC